MKTGITVSATGSASAAPDRATVTIGTSALRSTVSEATDQVDARVRDLLNALSHHGVPRSDVQTSDLSVWPEDDRNGALAGYRARNLVQIRIKNVETVGDVMNAAIAALSDSAELEGLRFEREEVAGPETEARAKAWKAVTGKAAELAGLAGLNLGRPVSITESSGSAPIVPRPMRMAAELLSAPVEPGTTTIQVHLTVRFALVE